MKHIVLSIVVLLATQVVDAYPNRGGSNYIYYQMDTGCNREDYGVIYNYNIPAATSTINSELQAMYNDGQRRLRIPIFHGHNLNTGTVMDSQYGDLSTQFRTNLTNLLAEINSIGFVEVEVSFFPSGDNAVINTSTWSTWNESMFQENWNTIYNLHSIIAGSGMTYRIDLENEGIPSPYESNYSVRLEYAQKLWNYYAYTFGTSDTVGFSTSADPNNLGTIPYVYGDSAFGNHGAPALYELHMYSDAYNAFVDANTTLNAQGYNPGWIIGEAFYNNSTEASAIASAMAYTSHTVFYVAQFPFTPSAGCGNGQPDVAPPFSFSNWEAYFNILRLAGPRLVVNSNFQQG